VPDPASFYRLQIRARNLGTAPASATDYRLHFIRLQSWAPLATEIVSANGNSAGAGSIGATIVGTPVVTATVGTSITGGTISPLTVAGITIETSAARTASGNGTTATNASAVGAHFIFNVSAVSGTTPTLVAQLQVQDSLSTNWVDVPGAATATITAIGTYLLTVYPSVAEVANSKISNALPRTYRWRWTIGGTTPSFTFSISAQNII
jgi:hypothetical protein